MQAHLAIDQKRTLAFGAVARQADAARQWNGQRLFVKLAGCQVNQVHKDRAEIANVPNRGRKEMRRRGDAIVIPPLDAEALQETQRVEPRVFQVAVEQRLARPADLGQPSLSVEQRRSGMQFSLGGLVRHFVFLSARRPEPCARLGCHRLELRNHPYTVLLRERCVYDMVTAISTGAWPASARLRHRTSVSQPRCISGP